MQYLFEKGGAFDAVKAIEIIKQRIKWMDDKNIRLWNDADYLKSYPLEYFIKNAEAGRLYLLKRISDGKTAAVAVIYDSDERWAGYEQSAYYIHHLAAALGEKGAGKVMLGFFYKLAKERGKEYLRLDCAKDSKTLNDYYRDLGFSLAGTCEEDGYSGNLREKKIVFND